MKYLIALISLLFLISCKSDASEEVIQIRAQYKSIIESSCEDLRALSDEGDAVKRSIQVFLLDFPGTKFEAELNGYLSGIDKVMLDVLQNCLTQQATRLKTTSFKSYAEAIENYNDKIEFAKLIIQKYPMPSNENGFGNIINELSDRVKQLKHENRYYLALTGNFRKKHSISDANDEISEINLFLDRFEETPMHESLVGRIDTLEFTKFQLISDASISSIGKLNEVLAQCEAIRKKLSTSGFNDKILERMDEIESSRTEVFRNELKYAEQNLYAQMETRAKQFSNDAVHDLCQDVISSKMDKEHKREFVEKIVYDCLFDLQTKGGFLCQSIYLTKVKVVGELIGDDQSGVYEIVTAVELQSDNKID